MATINTAMGNAIETGLGGELGVTMRQVNIEAAPAFAPVQRLRRADVPPDTVSMARFLLGKLLVREFHTETLVGRIVETEAYLPGDPACHAYRGMTPRNRSLFLDAGYAYVYVCHGTHHLLNVSSVGAGIGAGVLLRALEPLAGIESMRRARRTTVVRDLARGPGRLTAAFDIDRRHDGCDLLEGGGPLWIGSDSARVGAIGDSVRIGLTRGAEARLRFFVKGSIYLSGTRRLNASSA